MTPERLIRFLVDYRQMRAMQLEYRKTIDSRLRHRLPLIEEQQDREAELLLSALEDAVIRNAVAELLGVEGGVA